MVRGKPQQRAGTLSPLAPRWLAVTASEDSSACGHAPARVGGHGVILAIRMRRLGKPPGVFAARALANLSQPRGEKPRLLGALGTTGKKIVGCGLLPPPV